jgi:hypothetical protein
MHTGLKSMGRSMRLLPNFLRGCENRDRGRINLDLCLLSIPPCLICYLFITNLTLAGDLGKTGWTHSTHSLTFTSHVISALFQLWVPILWVFKITIFMFSDIGRQPANASDVRPLHLARRSHQVGLRPQTEMSLLPGRAEPEWRATNQFLDVSHLCVNPCNTCVSQSSLSKN